MSRGIVSGPVGRFGIVSARGRTAGESERAFYYNMEAEVARRIAEGDLRERVVARVVELLKSDEVQARLTKEVDEKRAARRQELLAAVSEEGDGAVREARQKEEQRLSESRLAVDIMQENARLVAAEARRREEEERRGRTGAGLHRQSSHSPRGV